MYTKISIYLLLFVLAVQPCFAQNQQDRYKDAFHLLDKWFEAHRNYRHLPAVSAAIIKDQEIIWSKAYGTANVEDKVNASTSTIFSICSISKLFTSIAIMQLYDAGKLRLDDRVESILPEIRSHQIFNEDKDITIRSLLTHSSGLPRGKSMHPYKSKSNSNFPTKERLHKKLGKMQQYYPTSTYFQYSNLGMKFLGDIVAKISGKSFGEYVEENILKPLKLAQTHPYLPADQWGKEMAVGYAALTMDGKRAKLDLFDEKGMEPAAGFSSNVEDLARFASWQFRLLENGGTEILKASTLKDMHRVHWTNPGGGSTWGLGFSVSQSGNTIRVGHGGSCPGYRTTLNIYPKNKMAYTAMINAGNESPEVVANALRNVILRVPGRARKSEVNLKDYEGHYDYQPWAAETLVVPWYGDLALISFPSSSPQNMTLIKHVEGDVFRRLRGDRTLAEIISFERDSNGKVVKMWRNTKFATKLDK